MAAHKLPYSWACSLGCAEKGRLMPPSHPREMGPGHRCVGTNSLGDTSVPEEGEGAERSWVMPSAVQTPEGKGRCHGPPGPALCEGCRRPRPGTGLCRCHPDLPPASALPATRGRAVQGRCARKAALSPFRGSAGRCRLRGAAARWRCALRNGASAQPPLTAPRFSRPPA